MGRDKAKKFSSSYEARMGQDKTMQDEDEGPIFRPHPTPLPSLIWGLHVF